MRQYRYFYTLYVIIATAIAAWALASMHISDWWTLLPFMIAILLLLHWRVQICSSIVQPGSMPLVYLALLCLPVHMAVIIDGLNAMFASFVVHRKASCTVFNVANAVVPMFVVGMLWQSISLPAESSIWLTTALAFVIVCMRYALNLIGLAYWTSIHSDAKFKQLFKELTGAGGTAGIGIRFFAITGMFVYHQEPLAAIVIMCIIVVSMLRSFQFYVQRDIISRTANTDELTEVGNRHAWQATLARLAKKPEGPYIVALFDLDGMKEVNDTSGHYVGDEVLKSFTRHLSEMIGRRNIYRFGGDEFVALFTRKNREQMEQLHNILTVGLSCFRNEWLQQNINISASFGLAYLEDIEDIQAALRQADLAMYENKKGSNLSPIHSLP